MRSLKLDTPKSLSQRVMQRLRQAIIDGEFALGAAISEEMVANSFGVSRTPVREAMGLLQAQGLVVIRPQVGSFVRKTSLRSALSGSRSNPGRPSSPFAMIATAPLR